MKGRMITLGRPARSGGTRRLVAIVGVACAILAPAAPAVGQDDPVVGWFPTDCPSPLVSGSIATVAGTGQSFAYPDDRGDGGPALEAPVSTKDVALGPSGDMYVTDAISPDIRRIDTDGTITTFAGKATGAPFGLIEDIEFDDAGNLYATDHPGNKVWRVDPAGVVTLFAGTGVLGTTGDEGPAVDAQIGAGSIGVSPAGQLYLAQDNLYRTITTDGIIHAFAGTGEVGSSGDGGPALEATFSNALGVAPDRAGNVYLVESDGQRIRRVDADGIITTVVGSGQRGHTGDGGPALDATLADPVEVAVDERDGSIYFTDHHGPAVRHVAADGTISTVAGQLGSSGSSGDCGPATEAKLDQPWGLAIHDGVLFIADIGNHRIRMVVP